MRLKRNILPFAFVFSLLASLLVLSGCATVGEKTPAGASSASHKTTIEENAASAHIECVVFEKLNEKERVSILLSDMPDYGISGKSDDTLLINFSGVSIPEGIQTKYDGGVLRNLRELTLYQPATNGTQEAHARMLLKKMVPYSYRDDGTRFIIDFDVSSLSQTPKDNSAATAITPSPEKIDSQTGDFHLYTGEKITLDLQDDDITSIFRLISEISGLNIVAGPDVKSRVSVHMKDVPWDQALETILEINALGKKQTGNVVIVLPLEQLKKAEEERQKKDVAQGRLKQISIEAKIVEVSTSFDKEIGVRWGAGYKAGSFAMGIGNSSSGTVTKIPGSGIGFTNSNVAVNFPSVLASAVTTPAIGMVLGTSKMILDAKLSALESTGDGKIISSPKVTTLDGVTATIEQGEEIPLITLDDNGNSVVSSFKDATLKLEVTPTLTPAGMISIVVKAKNDYADWTYKGTGVVSDNPPIKTSSVKSTVVVADGDTIVIGGVYKTVASESMEAVPWLSNIPVLGWLFKYKSVSKDERELLIFVTPKIIPE
ncbi:MAG: secretin and TonB N-terminal domain-containing protein [Thermodesulfobacteriota bacterium]|nr:secretin and TonB N-terminal domain-containing protein [Thermodesulfobacteriota bacterium]